jgi:hypothetical protein
MNRVVSSAILILTALGLLAVSLVLLGLRPSRVVEVEDLVKDFGETADPALGIDERYARMQPYAKSNPAIALRRRVAIESVRQFALRVLDSETDLGIPDVSVQVFSVGAREFRLMHDLQAHAGRDLTVLLPDGSLECWVLDIRAPGYARQQYRLSRFLKGEEDQVEVEEIPLEKVRCLTGRVLTPSGLPAQGVAIKGPDRIELWTDAQGAYSFPAPLEEDRIDKICVEAWKGDLGRATLEVAVEDVKSLTLPDLVLQGLHVIRGRFQLEDGSPVSGLKVMVDHVDHEPWDENVPGRVEACGRTDARGCFVLKGLVEGRYELRMALADLEERALRLHEWVDLGATMVTGDSRTWRFQRLDVEVRFADSTGTEHVSMNVQLPGEDGDTLSASWKPRSVEGQRSFALPVGTMVEVLAESPGRTWAVGRTRLQSDRAHRRLSLVVPSFDSWVPVVLQVLDPRLMQEKTVRVEVDLPEQYLDPRLTTESEPGMFHFRLPVGRQMIRLSLTDRHVSHGCYPAPPGAKKRHEKPDCVPLEGWLTEERCLVVQRGKSLEIRWHPRPATGFCFVFDTKAPAKDRPMLACVQVDRLDASGRRALAWIRPMGAQWGKTNWWIPELTPGRHVFRFQALGFEPVVHSVWLDANQERLVRVQLLPRAERKNSSELTEPDRRSPGQRAVR